MFSAALCRSLIEAVVIYLQSDAVYVSFLRLYAAASLKPRPPPDLLDRYRAFSAALCRSLIEATYAQEVVAVQRWTFSAALCRSLIEAYHSGEIVPPV